MTTSMTVALDHVCRATSALLDRRLHTTEDTVVVKLPAAAAAGDDTWVLYYRHRRIANMVNGRLTVNCWLGSIRAANAVLATATGSAQLQFTRQNARGRYPMYLGGGPAVWISVLDCWQTTVTPVRA